MPRPRKVPAVLVEATVRRNAKLANLSSDTARLGFFYVVLGDAKLSEPVPGQFASRALFEDVAGRFAAYLDEYLAAGLIEVAPRLCSRCKAAWSAMPPRSGSLVVHDWHEHQYDPRKLERQREYEDRQRALATLEGEQSDGVSDAQSDAQSDEVSDANPTGDSRAARDTRVAGTSRPRRDRASNVERESKNSPKSPAGAGDPVNPRENGTNPRTLGTSPRQVAAAAKAERDELAKGKAWRRNQRKLAVYRGAMTDEQRADQDARDAKVEEVPDWAEHQAKLRAEAEAPSPLVAWMPPT